MLVPQSIQWTRWSRSSKRSRTLVRHTLHEGTAGHGCQCPVSTSKHQAQQCYLWWQKGSVESRQASCTATQIFILTSVPVSEDLTAI